MRIYKIYVAFTNKAILWYFPLREKKKRELNLPRHLTCVILWINFKKTGTLDTLCHTTQSSPKKNTWKYLVTYFFLRQYLRKSGALEIMFSKSANPSFPSPSMSASSITFSQTKVISSAVSSSLVSLLRVFSRSALQMKLSVLKSKQ